MTERERAWDELIAATPPGWFFGQPSYDDARRQWQLFAFDPTEKAVVGVRQREWEAVGNSEEAVVKEMARCLTLINDGRVPT